MRISLKMAALAAVAGAVLCGSAASAADYLPSGVQNNVLTSTVTGGGWSECYSGAYGSYGDSISGILSSCSGSNLMLAGRATGSDTLLLLAQADRDDVTFDTGQNEFAVHNANGVDWYFNNDWSWGFAPQGVGVLKDSCDASGVFDGNTAGAAQRLCWHTGGGALQGGWRAGENVWLNSSSDFERVVFSFDGGGAVPEPATWALMIGGFGLAGAALRRRRVAVAA